MISSSQNLFSSRWAGPHLTERVWRHWLVAQIVVYDASLGLAAACMTLKGFPNRAQGARDKAEHPGGANEP